MTLLTETEGWSLLLGFGAAMITAVGLKNRAKKLCADSFLVADRSVSVWQGALSIAVSWIWAPAIFICSMQSFNLGLPGIFWFTAPNVLCFFLYAPFALRLRRMMPEGYSLPDYVFERFDHDRRVHLAFLFIFFGYQLFAIVINALAGGLLLNAVSGVDVRVAIVSIVLIVLAY
jgi:urea-proton symporter